MVIADILSLQPLRVLCGAAYVLVEHHSPSMSLAPVAFEIIQYFFLKRLS